MDTMIGVIGGSGVYQIDGLDDAEWVRSRAPSARRRTRC
jgi:5'-methylthioadenosine phosphorylase